MDAKLTEALKSKMLVPVAERFLGPRRWIFFYRTEAGRVPAKEFLDGLDMQVSASYARSFTKVVEGFQHRLRGERWHKLSGYNDLYEFKDNGSQTRLIHTTDAGGMFILLLGFGGKKENKIKKKHLSQADGLRKEYLRRRQAISEHLKGRRK